MMGSAISPARLMKTNAATEGYAYESNRKGVHFAVVLNSLLFQIGGGRKEEFRKRRETGSRLTYNED